jgi:hypothetical protein
MSLTQVRWPADTDPIQESLHQGQHCLFFNPATKYNHIKIWQTLDDICNWANNWIVQNGLDEFLEDQRNHFDIANLVKLNLWFDSIRKQGVSKPILILYHSDGQYSTGNGESRIKAAQRIPGMDTLPAFLATHSRNAHMFTDWEPITTLDQFAKCCGATEGNQFLFRIESADFEFGISWYEYDNPLTRSVMPNDADCVRVFETWYKNNPVVFSPAWFDQLVNWANYGLDI